MSITQQLTEEIVSVKFNDLPVETVTILKQAILDDIGIACFSYQQIDRPLAEYGKKVGGAVEATIIGNGEKGSCFMAAAVNAQMSTDSDFDETGPGVHAFSPINKTAIAVGELAGSSGKDVLTAIAIAYELNGRFARNIKTPITFLTFPKEVRRHLTLNTAIAAAKLLGLPASTINNALGVAWFTYVPPPLDYTLGKIGGEYRFRISPNMWSSQAGIQAVLLAQIGEGGPQDILDKDAIDIYRLENLLSSPSLFHGINRELCLKPWIGSYGFMGAIELAARLVKENKIRPDDIKEIVFRGGSIYANAPLAARNYNPQNYWQATNSVPWALANAILGFAPGPDWIGKEVLNEPSRIAIAKKVKVTAADAEDVNQVDIITSNNIYSDKISWSNFRGGAQRRMSQEEVESKFLRLAQPVIGKGNASEILQMCRNLEQVKDIKVLARHFSPG